MKIQSGDLRSRVRWMRPALAITHLSMGRRIPTDADLGTLYARIRPLSGAQLYAATMLRAATYHEITIRNVGPVAPGDFFLLGTRRLNFDSVINEAERGAYLVIRATEDATPGAPDG